MLKMQIQLSLEKKTQIRAQSFAKEAKTSRRDLKDPSALITSVGTSLCLGTKDELFLTCTDW